MEIEIPLLRKKIKDLIRQRIKGCSETNRTKPPIESKTTIIALEYDKGVIAVADKRVTEGFSIYSHRFTKIHRVSNYSVLGGAGTVGDIQEIVDSLREALDLLYRELETPQLTLRAQKNILRTIVRAKASWSLDNYELLLIGYERPAHRIIHFEGGGAVLPAQQGYQAIGSGSRSGARTILQRAARENPLICKNNLQENIKIALEALWSAADEDPGTEMPQIPSPETLPQVVVINETGAKSMDSLLVYQLWLKLLEPKVKPEIYKGEAK